MMLLGGWLFADLLLGLAMLFLTSGTSGTPPPTPTPTATPNELATNVAINRMTATAQAQEVVALNATLVSEQDAQATKDAQLSTMMTATARAQATEAAQSDSEQATAAALATQQAVQAEATIQAFATQQAESNANIDDVTRNLATAAAQATADAISAQQTISAQATNAAEVAKVATENANTGANAIATSNAAATELAEVKEIATQNAESGANDLATAQAEAEAAEATARALQKAQESSDADIATSEAEVANIQATVDAVAATATVIYQKAGLNSIDQGYAEVSITVDAQGLLDGDETAINDAKDAIKKAMKDYTDCRVGISLTFGWDPNVGTGTQIADIINGLLPDVYPDMFEDAAFQNFANIGPNGTVDFQLYFFRGCNALND
jgi:hypothetical protein